MAKKQETKDIEERYVSDFMKYYIAVSEECGEEPALVPFNEKYILLVNPKTVGRNPRFEEVLNDLTDEVMTTMNGQIKTDRLALKLDYMLATNKEKATNKQPNIEEKNNKCGLYAVNEFVNILEAQGLRPSDLMPLLINERYKFDAVMKQPKQASRVLTKKRVIANIVGAKRESENIIKKVAENARNARNAKENKSVTKENKTKKTTTFGR